MIRTARLFALLFALVVAAPSAGASDLGDFQERLNEATNRYRTTLTILRAGQTEAADGELSRLVDLWRSTTEDFASDPPGRYASMGLFAAAIEGVGARLARASVALKQGQTDQALELLQPLRREWVLLRRAGGFYGLGECLDEASEAFEALSALRRPAPDLTRGEIRGEISGRAAVYRWALKRCDAYAQSETLAEAEYRKLQETIAAAVDVIATAVRLRDGALLDRVLSDLRALDAALIQRFG